MIKNISPIRRMIIVLIIFVEFILGMSLSQKFLSWFAQGINSKTQALIFVLIMGGIWIPVLGIIYRRMNRLLRDLQAGISSPISKNALAFYGLLILFSFGTGIVILSFAGLIIYAVFGG